MIPRQLLATLIVAAAIAGGCRDVSTARALTRDEVYFGLSRPGGGGALSEEEFERFVDEEIAPRFPDGFTLLRAEGRWREASGKTVTEPSRVLVLYSQGPAAAKKVEAICRAYRARFDQEAVLRATSPARVEFITAGGKP